MEIAILGATGYIGRALFGELMTDESVKVAGYSRNVVSAKETLAGYKVPHTDINNYKEILSHEYEVIINATGIGSPKKLRENPAAVFEVTEEMDKMIFDYLDKYPKTRVFNISSGAVYGLAATSEVQEETEACFAINSLSAKEGYALAKLCSEVKHRARNKSSIVDLRVFAFVSRYLDPNDLFLVSDIAQSLKNEISLKTNSTDLVRDFTTAGDLVAVLKFLTEREPVNDVFNMKSKEAVSKFELLEKLKEELGLTFEVEELNESSHTGVKNVYAPKFSRLESLGYKPRYTSTENVTSELKAFLTL